MSGLTRDQELRVGAAQRLVHRLGVAEVLAVAYDPYPRAARRRRRRCRRPTRCRPRRSRRRPRRARRERVEARAEALARVPRDDSDSDVRHAGGSVGGYSVRVGVRYPLACSAVSVARPRDAAASHPGSPPSGSPDGAAEGRRITNEELGVTAQTRCHTGAPKASGSVLSGAGMMLVSRRHGRGPRVDRHDPDRAAPLESDWGAYSLIFNLLGIVGLLADLQISRVVMVELIDADDDIEPRSSAATSRCASRSRSRRYVLAFGVVVVLRATNPDQYPKEVVVGTLVGGLELLHGVHHVGARHGVPDQGCGCGRSRSRSRSASSCSSPSPSCSTRPTRGTIVRYAIPAVLYDLTSMVFVLFAVRAASCGCGPRIDLAAVVDLDQGGGAARARQLARHALLPDRHGHAVEARQPERGRSLPVRLQVLRHPRVRRVVAARCRAAAARPGVARPHRPTSTRSSARRSWCS